MPRYGLRKLVANLHGNLSWYNLDYTAYHWSFFWFLKGPLILVFLMIIIHHQLDSYFAIKVSKSGQTKISGWVTKSWYDLPDYFCDYKKCRSFSWLIRPCRLVGIACGNLSCDWQDRDTEICWLAELDDNNILQNRLYQQNDNFLWGEKEIFIFYKYNINYLFTKNIQILKRI